MFNLKFFARAERNIFHDVATFITELRKARIDRPVKNIALKQMDYFRSRVNADRLFKHREKIVYEDRQTGNMVYVWVCNDNVAYAVALRIVNTHGNAARVDGDAVIY